jgi:hypothetical protein
MARVSPWFRVVTLWVLATAALVAQQPLPNDDAGFVISGHIVDPHRLRPQTATLLLGHQEGSSYSSTPVEVAADGSFRTVRVTPGTYVFELVRDAFAPGAHGGVIGFATATVAASDVSGVRIDVRRDSTITGRYRLESDNPRAEPPPHIHVIAFLALDGESILTHSPPENGPDNTFVLRNLFGPRVLRCGYQLAPGSFWWPSRVLLDGRDVTNVPTDFSHHPDARVEVVFTQHPARLAGMVKNAQGQPAPAAWVLVTGSDPASWQPWATTSEVVQTNARGQYAVVVPPGEYRVNAVPEVRFPSRTVARSGMSRVAFGGVAVAVKDRETTRVDVTLQER